ncbi:MarR family transcriptional regulator [Propioniciclava sp.]|uniref:arsenate-mycothiol transferase ArsC n=1 Tax=Propioniciclava sp. TaxID=2038686 RepID=UPI0026383E28|nr:MarR family transcriptional regulator [Propioniciclava sp.]
MQDRETRARAYAALGEVSRLAIVEALAHGDLSSSELSVRLDMPSNLLAHHLAVLAAAGLVARHRSEGDGRRTYVSRTPACNALLGVPRSVKPRRVAFVCSQNSARSQLAEAYWRRVSDVPVVSAGVHPAERVHPGAVATGGRHGLDLTRAQPKLVTDVLEPEDLVVAVCDRAHEELDTARLHWSIPDPVRAGGERAFDAAYADIADRALRMAGSFEGANP